MALTMNWVLITFRDNMKYDLKDMVQRDHNFCIVDEVDSILIDESRTPFNYIRQSRR